MGEKLVINLPIAIHLRVPFKYVERLGKQYLNLFLNNTEFSYFYNSSIGERARLERYSKVDQRSINNISEFMNFQQHIVEIELKNYKKIMLEILNWGGGSVSSSVDIYTYYT